MQLNLIITGFLIFTCLFKATVNAQQTDTGKEKVQSANGFLAIQVGVPSTAMQKAIKNNMGNLGFGAGFAVLSNPFTWGKNKRNSPLRIGGEAGYTYYGRFLSDVNINGYHGDYKTSYGILQLNALLQLRPTHEEPITPFLEILAGGSFYISRIKENLDLIETSIGVETFDLDSYSSASFNKGVAIGCYIGNYQKKESPRFTIRISYNRGNHIKYIVRNSLIYNAANNRLEYEVDRAPVSYFMVQLGIGR
ncbi:MAG: hypothetical protein ABI675_21270 [Chitinophagaceae bacterium]